MGTFCVATSLRDVREAGRKAGEPWNEDGALSPARPAGTWLQAHYNCIARGALHARCSRMPTSDAPRIRTEVQVMFFDTDCAAVVHNIAYLRFIEIARTLLAAELGMSLAQMATDQKYPVVVRTEIDYRRPAKLGDQLVIEGWLDQLERVRFWCAFRIVRPADGTLIATCRQMLALIEMPAGKLLRLPEDWEKYRA